MDLQSKLKDLYNIIPWPFGPDSEEGRGYFKKSKEMMLKLINYIWIEEVLRKG